MSSALTYCRRFAIYAILEIKLHVFEPDRVGEGVRVKAVVVMEHGYPSEPTTGTEGGSGFRIVIDGFEYLCHVQKNFDNY